MAGVEAGIGQEVPRCYVQVAPWMDSRSGGGNGLGGLGVLHAGLSWWNGWSLGGQRPGCLNATPCRGSLAGRSSDAVCMGCPGESSGAELGAGLWSPSMRFTGVMLGVWLGLMWARGTGLTEVGGRLGYLDLVSVCTIKVERKCKWHLPAPLTLERAFQQLPCHLADALGPAPLYSSFPFKL